MSTFGTVVDPAHFVEVFNPAAPTAAPTRPAAGTTLLVQNYATGASMPNITTQAGGYWIYTATNVPSIRVSGDGGSTWVGPLIAIEDQLAGSQAGPTAATALTNSQNAVTTANQALQLVQQNPGFTGTVDYVTQVTNKPVIPTTAAQVGALATGDRGAQEGVAALTSGKVPIGQIPTGTTSATVALGNHTHAFGFDAIPGGVTVRSVIEIDEISPGVYPTLTAAQARADIKRVWNGSIRPTVAQGLRDRDKWYNEAV